MDGFSVVYGRLDGFSVKLIAVNIYYNPVKNYVDGGRIMDKYKENWITLVPEEVIECSSKGDESMKKEAELYNNVYKEISEIVGLDATLKIYLRFKGQQVSFPVRLYNPQLIQQNVIKEFDGTNVRELAKKYDYSEKTIRRMIRDSVELVEYEDDSYVDEE